MLVVAALIVPDPEELLDEPPAEAVTVSTSLNTILLFTVIVVRAKP